MGDAWTAWIFTLLAIFELVTDQFRRRRAAMSLCSLALALFRRPIGSDSRRCGRILDRGPIAGVIGAVIGTYGGAGIRARMAEALGATRPRHSSRTPALSSLGSHHLGAAMSRPFDAIVIGAGQPARRWSAGSRRPGRRSRSSSAI